MVRGRTSPEQAQPTLMPAVSYVKISRCTNYAVTLFSVGGWFSTYAL